MIQALKITFFDDEDVLSILQEDFQSISRLKVWLLDKYLPTFDEKSDLPRFCTIEDYLSEHCPFTELSKLYQLVKDKQNHLVEWITWASLYTDEFYIYFLISHLSFIFECMLATSLWWLIRFLVQKTHQSPKMSWKYA